MPTLGLLAEASFLADELLLAGDQPGCLLLAFFPSIGGPAIEMPLPLEHDVTEEILTRLNAKVEEIQILDLDEYGVYTEVVIGFKDGKLRMEVCPGDGIALALKYGAPIFLSEDLTPQASPCREAAAPFEEHPNIPLELSEDPEFEERFEEIDPDGAGYTHLPQAGLLEATELVVFDAIDELLEDSGIDAATGAIELNPDVALEALSSLLAHAVSQEHYEEAKRLRSEISRLEGVRQA